MTRPSNISTSDYDCSIWSYDETEDRFIRVKCLAKDGTVSTNLNPGCLTLKPDLLTFNYWASSSVRNGMSEYMLRPSLFGSFHPFLYKALPGRSGEWWVVPMAIKEGQRNIFFFWMRRLSLCLAVEWWIEGEGRRMHWGPILMSPLPKCLPPSEIILAWLIFTSTQNHGCHSAWMWKGSRKPFCMGIRGSSQTSSLKLKWTFISTPQNVRRTAQWSTASRWASLCTLSVETYSSWRSGKSWWRPHRSVMWQHPHRALPYVVQVSAAEGGGQQLDRVAFTHV